MAFVINPLTGRHINTDHIRYYPKELVSQLTSVTKKVEDEVVVSKKKDTKKVEEEVVSKKKDDDSLGETVRYDLEYLLLEDALSSYLTNKQLVILTQTMKKVNYLCKNNVALSTRVETYKFHKFSHMKFRIGQAIRCEKSKSGSTRPFIKKYLETNFKIDPTDPRINKTIRVMLWEGSLIPNKTKKQHFRLSSDYKKRIDKDFHDIIKKYKIDDFDIESESESSSSDSYYDDTESSDSYYNDSDDEEFIP